MNKHIMWLGIALLVQAVVIAFGWFNVNDESASGGLSIGLSAAAVDELQLSDGTAQVRLVREGSGWQLSGDGVDAPADADKVESLLQKLTGLSASWPVASTSASAERFEVAAENFQRRVRLQGDGETLLELYLGTSPGFQRVHARQSGSAEIYSVGLSNHELGLDVDDWLARDVLASPETPSRIVLQRVAGAEEQQQSTTLRSTDDGWLINDAPADQAAADAYAARFTKLRVLGLASADRATRELAMLRLTVQGAERTLRISRTDESDDYIVQDAAGGRAYRLAAYVAEQLLMTDMDFSASQDQPVTMQNTESDQEEGEGA